MMRKSTGKRILIFILLILFIVPLSLVAYGYIRGLIYMGGKNPEYITYLKKNSELIPPTGALNLTLFDSTCLTASVFLLGEIHGYADVQSLDDRLFIFLNHKAGVRHYIAEMDSIRAKQLNTFLAGDTSDTLLLKQVIKAVALRIPQQSSRELYQKWLRLYTYNKALSTDKKIVVHGIDTDFSDTLTTISRDSAMFLNLQSILAKQPLKGEKFYGLFGYYHVLQAGIGQKDRYPFAAKLKRSNCLGPNAIRSLICLPLESNMYMPATIPGYPKVPHEQLAWFNADGPLALVYGIEDLKSSSRLNTQTLFRLDGAQSPYKTDQRLLGVRSTLIGDNILPATTTRPTTDYYQYVVLLRGSKALTKL